MLDQEGQRAVGKEGSGVAGPLAHLRVLDRVAALFARRWRLVVIAFLLTLVGGILYTALVPPVYEANAVVLAVRERDTLVSILESDAHAARVASNLGYAQPGSREDLDAGRRALLAESSVVLNYRRGSQGAGLNQIIIVVTAHDADLAARVANEYVTTLEDWRPDLQAVTFGKRWESSYEQAGRNETLARRQLENSTQGFAYFSLVEAAATPSEPVSPSWRLNLAVAATLGVALAFLVPFAAESLRPEAGRRGNEGSGRRG